MSEVPSILAVIQEGRRLVFEPEPKHPDCALPWIVRNQEFEIHWDPGHGIDRIELREFKALAGPPWQEVKCDCGVHLWLDGNPADLIPLNQEATTHLVKLATCWPSRFGHRLITFTVTVWEIGREEPLVSFVDPWDEKPC